MEVRPLSSISRGSGNLSGCLCNDIKHGSMESMSRQGNGNESRDVPPKTYSTRYGALFLFADTYYTWSSRKRRQNEKVELCDDLKTLKNFRSLILHFGEDDNAFIHGVRKLIRRQSRKNSRKKTSKYAFNTNTTWNPPTNCTDTNDIDSRLVEQYFHSVIPDLKMAGLVFQTSKTNNNKVQEKQAGFIFPNIKKQQSVNTTKPDHREVDETTKLNYKIFEFPKTRKVSQGSYVGQIKELNRTESMLPKIVPSTVNCNGKSFPKINNTITTEYTRPMKENDLKLPCLGDEGTKHTRDSRSVYHISNPTSVGKQLPLLSIQNTEQCRDPKFVYHRSNPTSVAKELPRLVEKDSRITRDPRFAYRPNPLSAVKKSTHHHHSPPPPPVKDKVITRKRNLTIQGNSLSFTGKESHHIDILNLNSPLSFNERRLLQDADENSETTTLYSDENENERRFQNDDVFEGEFDKSLNRIDTHTQNILIFDNDDNSDINLFNGCDRGKADTLLTQNEIETSMSEPIRAAYKEHDDLDDVAMRRTVPLLPTRPVMIRSCDTSSPPMLQSQQPPHLSVDIESSTNATPDATSTHAISKSDFDVNEEIRMNNDDNDGIIQQLSGEVVIVSDDVINETFGENLQQRRSSSNNDEKPSTTDAGGLVLHATQHSTQEEEETIEKENEIEKLYCDADFSGEKATDQEKHESQQQEEIFNDLHASQFDDVTNISDKISSPLVHELTISDSGMKQTISDSGMKQNVHEKDVGKTQRKIKLSKVKNYVTDQIKDDSNCPINKINESDENQRKIFENVTNHKPIPNNKQESKKSKKNTKNTKDIKSKKTKASNNKHSKLKRNKTPHTLARQTFPPVEDAFIVKEDSILCNNEILACSDIDDSTSLFASTTDHLTAHIIDEYKALRLTSADKGGDKVMKNEDVVFEVCEIGRVEDDDFFNDDEDDDDIDDEENEIVEGNGNKKFADKTQRKKAAMERRAKIEEKRREKERQKQAALDEEERRRKFEEEMEREAAQRAEEKLRLLENERFREMEKEQQRCEQERRRQMEAERREAEKLAMMERMSLLIAQREAEEQMRLAKEQLAREIEEALRRKEEELLAAMEEEERARYLEERCKEDARCAMEEERHRQQVEMQRMIAEKERQQKLKELQHLYKQMMKRKHQNTRFKKGKDLLGVAHDISRAHSYSYFGGLPVLVEEGNPDPNQMGYRGKGDESLPSLSELMEQINEKQI